MGASIPERFGWAVDILSVDSADHLLEIGCGRGVAVALIAPELNRGRILAIDRSATAIAAARDRNSTWEALGRAAFRHATLVDLAGGDGRFDKIFSINVNLFWTDPRAELPVVRKLLKKQGKLHLFYEPPVPSQRDRIASLVREKLLGSGLVVERVIKKDGETPLLCLICGLS